MQVKSGAKMLKIRAVNSQKHRCCHMPFAVLAVVALAISFGFSAAARGAAYSLPDEHTEVVGALLPMTLRYEDTLASVAEAQGLGWRELVDANPEVDAWLPGEGTVITLPTKYVLPSGPREGVVINIPEFRLYYFPPGRSMVVTFPVGLGRLDFPTPIVTTKIRAAVPNPSWTPGPNARREHAERGNPLPAVVPPGPDNPMGSLALVLDIPSYFIHGTNQPFAVGQTASLGCIRMYDAHVETLAELTRLGTPVRIINEPYKVGWRDGELYLEVHSDIYEMAEEGELEKRIRAATKNRAAVIDWARVKAMVERPTGIPTRI
jgi:L,D-transpeptidase ErfK/SrfK